MNKNKFIITPLLCLAIFSANAEVEITGKITYETAKFIKSGKTVGADSSNGHDVFKNEVSARFYIDGELGEESSFHAEIQGMIDGEATNDELRSYTQRDPLRELYIDTNYQNWSIRAGKQQLAWGVADGSKLLDMINPTDYTEMAQNQMEDSRIPVWMINAETEFENGNSLQIVLSQPKENIFAGLNRNINTSVRRNTTRDITKSGTDSNHPFMMMGPDAITGKTNGFLNIAPDLGSIAAGFAGQFTSAGLKNSTGLTVGMFNRMTNAQLGAMPLPSTAIQLTGAIANGADGTQIMNGFAAGFNTNLNKATSASDWGVVKDSAFEYMENATFSTFDSFYMAGSQYAYDMPKDTDLDLALKFKGSAQNGLNYSVVASYNYDKNPILGLSWRGENGEKLNVIKSVNHFTQIGATTTATAGNYAYSTTSLALNTKADGTGQAYGGVANKSATLQFKQTVERVKQIGLALDTSIDTNSLGPVVLRGEFLYTKDGYQPVMTKSLLSIGDLVGSLQMKKADRFKYVLGVDITVLTNMLVSMQFIQDRNLDHIDGSDRYTTDYATMSMSNGFQKAEKNKDFYSLFLSKPFGSSGEHRINNMFMYEENGGKWNRLDVEYSINDDMVGTFEFNKYFGDKNTQFGQLKNSSNIQLGFKYSF